MTAPLFTLAEAAELFRGRKVSSVELTQACLDRIARLNPKLNAFITVTDELALQHARQADNDLAAGNWRGPLHGIPVAMKDLIDLAGVTTTAASRQLSNNVPTHDAAVVSGLKQAGAVIVGKTNLHEFAFGGSGMVSAYGPARNPWDASRITGGSSSGTAAAVAAGMCIAAIGTDTAGSVRIPASLCGIVGHRPSAGIWSTTGIIPLRRSFDTAGPMTRTVQDAWLMLHALANGGSHLAMDRNVDRLRAGVARAGFFDGCDADVSNCVEQALDVIRSLTASIRDVSLEVRIRWTDFDEEILDYHRPMMERSPELYQPATLDRLRACTSISSADYEQARDSLVAARRDAERVFEAVDVVVTPTCLVDAPRIATLSAMTSADLRAFEVQKLLRDTAPFSLLYWPSVSVPCGFTSRGLPVGMQISARPGADDLALRVARAYEQATEWHTSVPPVAD
jgi:aspartyl-tRNA(Asn)/glutamyl-tRNA(Gln) amidotransferase subunit A